MKLLKSTKEFGGPQSIDDVCKNLRISNNNARSIMSKMYKKEKIERIGKGVYRAKQDKRDYDPDKPHYSK